MRPVTAERIGIEVKRPGALQHIGRCVRIGDEPVDVHVAVEIAEVEAGNIALAGHEAAAPQIDSELKADQPAAGARVGKGLVVVVDLLTDDAAPRGAGPALGVGAGIPNRQRIADPLMQRAERGEAHLPGDRLHHATTTANRGPMIGKTPGGSGSGGGSDGSAVIGGVGGVTGGVVGPVGGVIGGVVGPVGGTMKSSRRNQSLGALASTLPRNNR